MWVWLTYLTAAVPKVNWFIVTRVHPHPCRVGATEVSLVILDEMGGLRVRVFER